MLCLWSGRLLTVMPQRWRSSRRSSDSSRLLSATSLSATIRRWDGDVAWHPSPPRTTRTRTCRSSPCQPTYCRYRLGHLSPPSFCCPDTKEMSAWRSCSTCVYQTCNEIFIYIIRKRANSASACGLVHPQLFMAPRIRRLRPAAWEWPRLLIFIFNWIQKEKRHS